MTRFANFLLAGFGFVALLAAPLLMTSGVGQAQQGKSLDQRVAALEASLTALQARVAAVETKVQYVSVNAGEMYITGSNLHIINGLGSTDQVNGLGNLVI